MLEHVVARGVAARDGERVLRDVARVDAQLAQLARERHRDRAAAGADVGRGPVLAPDRAQVAHGPLDRELRLRARHQHALVDAEHAPVESGFAGDVRERRPARAPLDELAEPLHDVGRELALAVRDHLLPRDAAGVREQKHRIEPPRAADRLEPHGCVTQRLADRHAALVSPARSRAFSSFCSSTTSFSMSPSRITLMFWKFWLMRWSVMRSCG